MRVVDVFMGVPTLPFAIVVVTVAGPSIEHIIFVITLLFWRTSARVIRSSVLTLRELGYMRAARVAGAGHLRMRRAAAEQPPALKQGLQANLRPAFEARQIGQQPIHCLEAAVEQIGLARPHAGSSHIEKVYHAKVDPPNGGPVVID